VRRYAAAAQPQDFKAMLDEYAIRYLEKKHKALRLNCAKLVIEKDVLPKWRSRPM
jgi:hypothetical protein